jgi:hypothetical protein
MITEYLLKNSLLYKGLITMKTALKVLAIMALMLIIFFSLHGNLESVFSTSQGGKLDIFTQKEPFSGRGLNISSDAFSPEEEVIIYASVTYNDYPVGGALVAFEIHGPENSMYNITFSTLNQTDDSGITRISFRIGLISQINFGEWKVFGIVLVADKTCQDFLSFKVGWIVEVASIKTVNGSYIEQTEFTKGNYVGIELSLRSIAMTEKKATLSIAIYDSLRVQINSTEIEDCNLQANGSILHIDCFLLIPEWACAGDAVASASAYTAPLSHGGIPYCPEKSKHFLIAYHNIAILSVKTSSAFVYKAETVNVSVTVKNWGQEIESFYVNAYYNETNLIDTSHVSNLEPNAEVTVIFVWNTSYLEEGFYQISAYVEPVPSETNFSDNLYVNGFVEVSTKPPRLVHDVAVLNVTPSSTLIYIGETVDICVVVKNQGNYTESFNLAASYSDNEIETKFVENLEPNTEKTLIFHWNTQNVQQGNYTLSASASLVSEEIDISDNTYSDGVVEVKAKPTPPPFLIHDVAVLNVTPSSTLIYIGETVDICVVVKNQGNYTESFNLAASYSDNEIETKFVENLEPNTEKTLIFHWNTRNVVEGNYALSASTSQVPGEENLENNSYEDGIVTVAKAPMGWYVPYWFYWLLLLLLIPIIILLIAWYYSRKRRKRAEEAFYSGWTAWYYGRDMRKRTSKT